MNKMYKKNIASFMIVLILTTPIYLSSVFAQDTPFSVESLSGPVQSCVERSQEGQELVEFLDSGPINTLETVASTLHFTCTVWSTTEVVFNAYVQVTGTLNICPSQNYPLCAANSKEMIAKIPGNKVFESMCNLAECKYSKLDGGGGFLGSLDSTLGSVGLGPYDNIYTAIGGACPAAILFNLKKLKGIYQVHNCCIQEACSAGISTESCDMQLSEATCMYWQGSIALSMVKMLVHFISKFVTGLVEDEVEELVKKTGLGDYLGAIFALYNAYQHIESLMSTYQQMVESFSEPTCSDLNFGNIREQQRDTLESPPCELVEVDLNGDGIFDLLEPKCF